MITPEHRKELFSESYLGAIASQAGASFGRSPGFDYGNDFDFREIIEIDDLEAPGKKCLGPSGAMFSTQVKCTENLILDNTKGVLKFALKVSNYNKLIRISGGLKTILIVVQVPQEDERVTFGDDHMLLRHKAYWLDLEGWAPTTNESSITISIPVENVFNVEAIIRFFECLKKGEKLNA